MSAISGFLGWIDGRRLVSISTREMRAQVTPEVERALRASRVMRDGAPAVCWPCEEHADCVREVHDNHPAAAKPFVARCSRVPAECHAVELSADDRAEVAISLPDFVRALRALLGVDDGHASTSGALPRRAIEPIRLGAQSSGGSRDVFLATTLDSAALASFLALRGSADRPTLVLVPTASRLAPNTIARHGAGDHVEIVVLEDALTLRDGALALLSARPRMRLVSATQDARPAHAEEADGRRQRDRDLTKASGVALRPRVWGELEIAAIDLETVRAKVGARHIRCNPGDLGLASEQNRKPTKLWTLLLAICHGNGEFQWRNFGHGPKVKRLVADLRKKLKAAFGLDEDPFHPFSGSRGWRARFQAKPDGLDEQLLV